MRLPVGAGTSAVDTFIVERFKVALHALKPCNTAEQRRQYHILLLAVAPPLVKQGNKHGMINKVALRLEVPYGHRWAKGTKVDTPYAFTSAVQGRATFQVELVAAFKPKEDLLPGDAVLCRGQIARLTSYDAATGECSVTFFVEDAGIEKTVNYASRFGNDPKSARLQRPPVLLLPPPRKERSDKLSQEVKGHVLTIYETSCPTSPHQRDRLRRLLASFCWEEKQAMIQSDTLKNLFDAFIKEYPDDKLGFTMFKMLKPWNLKKAYRETCLCRMCELFRLYVGGLHTTARLLSRSVHTW